MVVITLQREKCIGCAYCAELDPTHFRMSRRDGKSVLLHSQEKKGFQTVKDPQLEGYAQVEKAGQACPVKIIQYKIS
jgi:ferredoxin